jgi:hypothetical protein
VRTAFLAVLGGLILVLAVSARPDVASAQAGFPTIPVWAYPGAYHPDAAGDTIQERSRTISLRWMRDPVAEARPDFGGYRIYRVTNEPDTSRMVLIRRFSVQFSFPVVLDSLFLWHFPRIDASTPLEDRIVTYIDPDSSGAFVKQCRVLDEHGQCASRGDSVFRLIAPPGPHDGFRTWYAITYEARNRTDNDFLDLFVPDLANCPTPQTPNTCPNLNSKNRNMTSAALEPTKGPTADLELVSVVPNPYRATEAWDTQTGHEVHFINLPSQAKIRIYTLSGDLVAELQHNDNVRDFERWNLKNQNGQDVSSGIYMYRVESSTFTFQHRFVVIR